MVNHGLVSSLPAAAHGSLHRLVDSEQQDSLHQFVENAAQLEDPTECRGSKPSRRTKAQTQDGAPIYTKWTKNTTELRKLLLADVTLD